jgi:choline dehydrogenase-like flavoprotein
MLIGVRTNRATSRGVIIGTGQAGPPLAKRLSEVGMSIAIIERHLFGGTCVNTGCIPTKAMVASAYAAHMAQRAGDYGVGIGGDITVNLKAVEARKDAISERSRMGSRRCCEAWRTAWSTTDTHGSDRLGRLMWPARCCVPIASLSTSADGHRHHRCPGSIASRT